MALKGQGYPPEETQALVRQYLATVIDRFVGVIDSKSLLIPVPSGSGLNMITEIMALEFKHQLGAGIAQEGLVMKKHSGKGNGGSDERHMAKEYLSRAHASHEDHDQVIHGLEGLYKENYPSIDNVNYEQARKLQMKDWLTYWKKELEKNNA